MLSKLLSLFQTTNIVSVRGATTVNSDNKKEIEIGEGIANFKFDSMNIMAKDKVLYKGHAVAAVCASDLNTAEEAIKKIKVKYKELEPVLSVDEAISQSATILHEDFVGTTPEGSKTNTNIAHCDRHGMSAESAELVRT